MLFAFSHRSALTVGFGCIVIPFEIPPSAVLSPTLPHPALHVQAALSRSTPCCEPLRRAAAARRGRGQRRGRGVAAGGGVRPGGRGEKGFCSSYTHTHTPYLHPTV